MFVWKLCYEVNSYCYVEVYYYVYLFCDCYICMLVGGVLIGMFFQVYIWIYYFFQLEGCDMMFNCGVLLYFFRGFVFVGIFCWC